MGKFTIFMAIFNCYVSSPEGSREVSPNIGKYRKIPFQEILNFADWGLAFPAKHPELVVFRCGFACGKQLQGDVMGVTVCRC